jgi:hydrogenase/urease accessory protein HupE
MTLLRRTKALCLLWCLALPVGAHDAKPVFVDVQQVDSTDYVIRLRVPPAVEPDNLPTLAWSDGCSVTNPRGTQLRCRNDDIVPAFTLVYPRGNPSLALAVRLQPLQGEDRWQVLPPDQLRWSAPAAPRWQATLFQYLWLGVEHILRGLDHLLFVTGLLLLAATWRRILIVVTGFTLSHSLTLGLAATDVITQPVAATEAVIALSILFLAYELSRPGHDSLTKRRPVWVAVGFGLLHGLGFAAVLGELGLPAGQLVTALAAFNVGVELGQLMFIAALISIVEVLRRVRPGASSLRPAALQRLGVYVIGMPAALWFLDRLSAILA